VGDISQVLVTVTTLNPIPPGGGLHIIMPKWNMMARPELRESFVFTPEEFTASTPTRRLNSTPGLCSPKADVAQSSYCRLDTTSNDDQDSLTLIDAFPDGQRAGKTFSFLVNYLRNPLSMSEVSFTLFTFSGISSKS
jgi:hypothetical protein